MNPTAHAINALLQEEGHTTTLVMDIADEIIIRANKHNIYFHPTHIYIRQIQHQTGQELDYADPQLINKITTFIKSNQNQTWTSSTPSKTSSKKKE